MRQIGMIGALAAAAMAGLGMGAALDVRLPEDEIRRRTPPPEPKAARNPTRRIYRPARAPNRKHQPCVLAPNTNRPKKLTLRLTRKEQGQYGPFALKNYRVRTI